MFAIFGRLTAAAAALSIIMVAPTASAYDVVNLPDSMTFSDALGIYDVSDIASATLCDTTHNRYVELSREQITEFYGLAESMTVWRKLNPTPFRGMCVNFRKNDGVGISYFYNGGIQIGTYGSDNYVCYMTTSSDTAELSYLQAYYYDNEDAAYGGTQMTAVTNSDFLKLPEAEWAQTAVKDAAAKNLVPYEFTDKYAQPISREQMAMLLANMITVAGNYAKLDDYLEERGIAYNRNGMFIDCAGCDEAIDQLSALGIVTGKTDDLFDPQGQVTRQEAAVLLTRTAELFMYVASSYSENPADYESIESWAKYHVMWNIDKGILSVDDSRRFYPTDSMTVQQAITAVSRLYDLATYWES